MKHRAVKVIAILAAVVAVLTLAGVGFYFGKVRPLINAGRNQGIYSSPASRSSVADFGFETMEGKYQSISNLKGYVVVVDVWATWCATCIRNIPNVVALRNKYAGSPVHIIGLDVDDDGWQKVKPFLTKYPEINYTIAVPSPAPSFLIQSIVDLAPLGEVSAVPTVFVVDRQGRLAGKFIELGHEREIDALIARLLKE